MEIVDQFLEQNGLEKGYRAIKVDQGGELAHSTAFAKLVEKHDYVPEPTGPDSAAQNGLAERQNGTLAVMTQALLYGAGLHPKFWSAALFHAVYLKNRRWHRMLNKTPLEARFGHPSDILHLRVFGSLVKAIKSGKRRAKLDRHSFRGVFLGYTETDKNVHYYDVDTSMDKTARHVVYDKAHYTVDQRPLMAAMLYHLGYEMAYGVDGDRIADTAVATPVCYPTMPCGPLRDCSEACSTHLSERLVAEPDLDAIRHAEAGPVAAAAARVTMTSPWTWEDVQQVEVSTDPFSASFDEWVTVMGMHPTLRLVLEEDDGGLLCLKDVAQGTALARLKRWRTCLWYAYLREINGQPVRSINDVKSVVWEARKWQTERLVLTFTHCEVPPGVTLEGIPQLCMDQMNTVWQHLVGMQKDAVTSNGVVMRQATIHCARLDLDQLRHVTRIQAVV